MASNISFKHATLIQFVSKYLGYAIQFALTMILARLLTPDEYGTVAIITVFLSFFTLLADMGLSPAIIQFKDLTRSDLSSLFFFSMMFGLVLGLLFVGLSFVIAAIYGIDELAPLGSFAAIAVVFGAWNMVPNGLLLRDLQFKLIGLRTVIVTLVGGCLAVALAFLGFGCYALVANTVFNSAFVFIWNATCGKLLPNNPHFMKAFKRVFSYAAFQFGFSFVNYFSRNLDNMLIGGVFGSTSLGFYEKAYKMTTYPVNLIPGTLSPVIQPYLSKYHDQPAMLYTYYIKIAKVLSLASAWLVPIMFFAAEEIVLVLYGDQWGEAVPLLQALCVSLIIQLQGNISGSILQSAGHTDYMFRVGIINSSITVICLLLGLATGSLNATAVFVSAAFCIHIVPIVYYLVHETLQHSVLDFAKQFVPEAIALVACAVALAVTDLLLPDIVLLALVVKVAVGTAVFLAVVMVFGQKSYFDFIVHSKRKVH